MTPAPAVLRRILILALGSNATENMQTNSQLLGEALSRFKGAGITIRSTSRTYRTAAFPPGAGPDFANACVLAEADVAPDRVLQALHAIEADMGRVRSRRWGQRVIDLDLLAEGDSVLPDRDTVAQWMTLPPARQATEAPDRLILPHPRLHQRAFVLVPMADVAPDWVHPVLGQSVRQMLAALDPEEIAAIRPI